MLTKKIGAALFGCALLSAAGSPLAAERAIPPSSAPPASGAQERAGLDPCAGDHFRCFGGGSDSSPGSRRAYNGPATDYYDVAPADAYPPSVEDSASFCASRYRSFDPRSGTYLGYDGRRHPCP